MWGLLPGRRGGLKQQVLACLWVIYIPRRVCIQGLVEFKVHRHPKAYFCCNSKANVPILFIFGTNILQCWGILLVYLLSKSIDFFFFFWFVADLGIFLVSARTLRQMYQLCSILVQIFYRSGELF